jgi:hypothetical protein
LARGDKKRVKGLKRELILWKGDTKIEKRILKPVALFLRPEKIYPSGGKEENPLSQ